MDKKRTKRRYKSAEPEPGKGLPLPDRRAMEKSLSDIGRLLSEREFGSPEEMNAFLQDIVASGEIPRSSKQRTLLEQAQDLMYDAWDSSGRRRVELACRALEISGDCADAYVLLAEETAGNLEKARNLYEQGVKAGERALGPEVFKEDAGHFWGILETRPYMRARLGLAQCLWSLGERRQAIEHYTDMLRLNPGDNQGIRYVLANCLLEEGLDGALGKLLEQYKDDAAATWSYSRALWVFRREGASKKANRCLKEALDDNRYVPFYLLGEKRLPRRLPEYIGFGDENEAVEYVAEAIRAWQKTEGALEWLRGNLPGRPDEA